MDTCVRIFQSFVNVYHRLIVGGNLLQPLILLAFRLTWGWQFFVTGKGKLLNHGDIAEFFGSLHIPFPDLSAWFVGGLECIGGLLLLIGLFSRPIALLLATTMTVAYMAVEDDRAKVLNMFHDPDPFLQADPFFFLLSSILVLAFGPGVISADALMKRCLFKKSCDITSGAMQKSDEGEARRLEQIAS